MRASSKCLVAAAVLCMFAWLAGAQEYKQLAAPADLKGISDVPVGTVLLDALGKSYGPNSEFNYSNEDWGTARFSITKMRELTVVADGKATVVGRVTGRYWKELTKFRGTQDKETRRYNRIAIICCEAACAASTLAELYNSLSSAGFWRIRVLVQDAKGGQFLVPLNIPGSVLVESGDFKRIEQPKEPKDGLPTPRRSVRVDPALPLEPPSDDDKPAKKPEIEAGALPIRLVCYLCEDADRKKHTLYVVECEEKETDQTVAVPKGYKVLDVGFFDGITNTGYGGLDGDGRKTALDKVREWAKELKSNELILEVTESMSLADAFEVIAAAHKADMVVRLHGK